MEEHIADDEKDIEKFMLFLGLDTKDVNIKTVSIAIRAGYQLCSSSVGTFLGTKYNNVHILPAYGKVESKTKE